MKNSCNHFDNRGNCLFGLGHGCPLLVWPDPCWTRQTVLQLLPCPRVFPSFALLLSTYWASGRRLSPFLVMGVLGQLCVLSRGLVFIRGAILLWCIHHHAALVDVFPADTGHCRQLLKKKKSLVFTNHLKSMQALIL